jgi:putative polyhydroxyalkanoate system protein
MSKIHVKKNHKLGLEQALKDAEQLAQMLSERFDAKYEWRDHTLRFHRTGVKGLLSVTENTLEINVELALLMRPFKAVVEREIHAYLEKELS